MGSLLSLQRLRSEERVSRVVRELQLEMENWLLKVSAEFQARVPQLLFHINNLDLISVVVTVCLHMLLEKFCFSTSKWL